MQHLEVDEHLNTVRLCVKGDAKAQKKIFDEFSGRMLSLCLRYVPDRMTAEDLLQDGFVTLFSKMDTYKGEGSFEGWMRRIFTTTCLMYLRRKDALKMSDDLENARSVSCTSASPMEVVGYRELMALMAAMPAGYRVVFNMFAVEGYSHREISMALGISEATSRSQYARARQWLQERMKSDEKGK